MLLLSEVLSLLVLFLLETRAAQGQATGCYMERDPVGLLLFLGSECNSKEPAAPSGDLWVVGEDAVGLVHQTTANMEIKVRSLACLDLDTNFDARKI